MRIARRAGVFVTWTGVFATWTGVFATWIRAVTPELSCHGEVMLALQINEV